MPESASASSLQQTMTITSTIGAALTALVGFPTTLTVFALAVVTLWAIGASLLGLEVPTEGAIEAWAQGDNTFLSTGTSLFAGVLCFLTLFLAFLPFRRANKKRAVLIFAVIYLAIELAMLSYGDVFTLWFPRGVLFACFVYYLHLRGVETMTPPA